MNDILNDVLNDVSHDVVWNWNYLQMLDLLPHPKLWANRLIHASLQQIDHVPPDRPLVLKNLENVSQRLRNFALFEPRPSDTTKAPPVEGRSSDEMYIEGDFKFVRDYIARVR